MIVLAKPKNRALIVQWPLTLTLLVLLMTACAALGAVLAGSAWWWVLLVVATVVLVVASMVRHLRVPGPIVPVLSVGVLTLTLTLFFGAGTGLLWLLPTGETLARFTGLAADGVRTIQTQGTPAQVDDGLLFLLAAGVGILAILMDLVAITLRWPALAGIPVLVPLVVPGIVVDDGAEWPILVATAAAYLLLLRVEVHLRGIRADTEGAAPALGVASAAGAVRGAVAIGALGIVSALLLSVAAPLGGTGSGGPNGNAALFGTGVSPMIDLGRDLRRPEAVPALHYRTTAADQPYLAMLTLDEIEGTSWLPRTVDADPQNTVDVIAEPPGLSAQVARNEARTSIAIDGVRSDLLPVPVPATSVSGLTGDWLWTAGTRAIRAEDTASTTGQRYTVTSLEVSPTREQLREAGGRYPGSVEASLELPVGTPAIIGETAATVTDGAESKYDAAVAIQDYLRGSEFRYDTEAPVEDDYDGGGADVIATFLDVKRGYCVHFASAMALMARSVDIPSRVTLGYLPGLRTSTVIGGLNRYNVDSRDLHSWPELYFTGVGWVAFEPTPGRGSVPDYARPESIAGANVPEGGAAPSVAPQANDDPTQQTDALGGAETPEESAGATLARIGVVVLALLVLGAVPGVLRRLRRRRRRRLLQSGRADATVAWHELIDTARDYGVEVMDTRTAGDLAADIRTHPGVGDTPEVVDALTRILVASERVHYARPPDAAANPTTRSTTAGAALVADLDLVLLALHNGAGSVARARALVVPASLSTPALRRMGLTGGTATAGANRGADPGTPRGA